jgi:phage major head subunit gpT-like protein
MGLRITSRSVVGDFYQRLDQDLGNSWIPGISMLFNSDQESEFYAWLSQVPLMREWVGSRLSKSLTEDGVIIVNKKFEATIEIPADWFKRDKTGQILIRINDLADRASSHWASLLTKLIIAGEASVCYDGQFFFDTDHVEDASGTQSNKISSFVLNPLQPSIDELQTAILKATEQMLNFKDSFGEPMNENAKNFTVMVPVSFMKSAASALGAELINGSSSNIQALGSLGGFSYNLAINPRLSWTNKFAVFRADGDAAAFIRQEEEGITVQALGEGSELEFNNDIHRYGVKALRNVGYGFWQRAVLNTFI